MLSSLLQRPNSTEQYFIIVILLLLLILALVAWNWVTTLPGPLRSLIGWAAVILTVLLTTELVPWQRGVETGAQLGAMGMAWMDAHPLVVLVVLPVLMLGSVLWKNPA